jgi:hypothetical protein
LPGHQGDITKAMMMTEEEEDDLLAMDIDGLVAKAYKDREE